MVNRPSVPEIITVNSEELQTQIRDLLPSQNGFGSELQASNVITPIIDLTRAAEGSTVPEDLQTAFAFGSITSFGISNTAGVTMINTTGFYRVYGQVSARIITSGSVDAEFTLSDGATSKSLVLYDFPQTATESHDTELFDFVVFLAAGHSLIGRTNSSSVFLNGCHRQIATGDGTLVQPNGFPL